MSVEISVVIPAYNAAATIGRQLEALAAQDWPGDWEVVIADNGSDDGTALRAREYESRLPALLVVDASQRRGAAHARNVGAEAARGEFLAFLDADDAAQPGWLAAMARGLASADCVAGHVVLVAPGENGEAGEVPPSLSARSLPSSRLARLLASRGFLDAAPMCNLGVRREVWKQVGGFRADMRAGEDTAFCWDVQLAGHPLARARDAVIHYSVRTSTKGLARQQFTWGVGVAQLYAAFRSVGAPRSSVLGALARWAYLLVTCPAAMFSLGFRRRWAAAVAARAGRLAGSFRYRVFCP